MKRTPLSRLAGIVIACTLSAFLAGCSNASYTTPGSPADLTGVTSSEMEENLTVEPAARFPARLAIVHLQGSDYGPNDHQCYGTGTYRIVSSSLSQSDHNPDKSLEDSPLIDSIAQLNRLILPEKINSIKDIRIAASKLHADLLLVYTLDTSFFVVDHEVGPLNAISLGFLPNQEAKVGCTASAALFDVRTGFVYGLAQGQAQDSNLASVWSSRDAVEKTRLKVEATALDSLWNQTSDVLGAMQKQIAKRQAAR